MFIVSGGLFYSGYQFRDSCVLSKTEKRFKIYDNCKKRKITIAASKCVEYHVKNYIALTSIYYSSELNTTIHQNYCGYR